MVLTLNSECLTPANYYVDPVQRMVLLSLDRYHRLSERDERARRVLAGPSEGQR